MEGLDGGVFDGSVHPLGLTVGPGVVGLGQPVLDLVLGADAIEDVAAEDGLDFGERPRFLGRSAKAMPLSVSTVCSL